MFAIMHPKCIIVGIGEGSRVQQETARAQETDQNPENLFHESVAAFPVSHSAVTTARASATMRSGFYMVDVVRDLTIAALKAADGAGVAGVIGRQ